MAWTDPKTWSVNEVVTAANMNTHVRDNLDWLANDLPRCRALRSSTQSINTGTDVAVAFNAADDYDVGAMHDTVTNNTRVTVPAGGGGVYAVSGYLRTDSTTGSFTRAFIRLRLNASTDFAELVLNPPIGTGILATLATDVELVAGDFIELILNHNVGASLNLTGAALTARWAAF